MPFEYVSNNAVGSSADAYDMFNIVVRRAKSLKGRSCMLALWRRCPTKP